uniref:Uncharacterized protein n=1 Tax=Salix viminalis TaxID=40686 RepID=A0A6N2M7Y8_SALVM
MEEEDNYVEYVPVAKRRALTAQMILQRRGNSSALEDELEKSKLAEAKPSLLLDISPNFHGNNPGITRSVTLQPRHLLQRTLVTSKGENE